MATKPITRELIQQQHESLLQRRNKLAHGSEKNATEFVLVVEEFLQTLSHAGAFFADLQYRSYLLSLIRFWGSFISDIRGVFPLVELEPSSPNAEDFEEDTGREEIVERSPNIDQGEHHNADIERAIFSSEHFQQIDIDKADLQKLILPNANFQKASLNYANLEKADLRNANLKQAYLNYANLEKADLSGANMEGTYLIRANLEKADLRSANMEGASLISANLKGADLRDANLSGAVLQRAIFDNSTLLTNVTFQKGETSAFLADINWNGVSLTAVEGWNTLILGEERSIEKAESRGTFATITDYDIVIRAYRQLAITLQLQGLEGASERFGFRSRNLQKTLYRLQGQWRHFVFYELLWLLSGYGYKLERCFAAYGTTILLFAIIYWSYFQIFISAPITMLKALTMSIYPFTLIFSTDIRINDILIYISIINAIWILFISLIFTATLLRRFLK